MFFQTVEDRFPAAVQFGQLRKAITDGGDMGLVQAAGDLLAVSCDEGNRGVLGKQFPHRFDLFNVDAQFMTDDGGVIDLGQWKTPGCQSGTLPYGRIVSLSAK